MTIFINTIFILIIYNYQFFVTFINNVYTCQMLNVIIC